MTGRKKATLEVRFWEKVRVAGRDECWHWTGHLTFGYGYIRRGKTMLRAHRLSYAMHHGPIPDKMQVCHRCDQPSCVNPGHLFLGTAKDNHLDMTNKNRASSPPRGLRGTVRINESLVSEIRRSYRDEWGIYSKLSEQFGISTSYIHKIINHKAWSPL